MYVNPFWLGVLVTVVVELVLLIGVCTFYALKRGDK